MNNQFDELTKSMAQSVTRRAALKKFGVGLAGMALAAFGLASKALGAPQAKIPNWCDRSTNFCCCRKSQTYLLPDDPNWWSCASACALG